MKRAGFWLVKPLAQAPSATLPVGMPSFSGGDSCFALVHRVPMRIQSFRTI